MATNDGFQPYALGLTALDAKTAIEKAHNETFDTLTVSGITALNGDLDIAPTQDILFGSSNDKSINGLNGLTLIDESQNISIEARGNDSYMYLKTADTVGTVKNCIVLGNGAAAEPNVKLMYSGSTVLETINNGVEITGSVPTLKLRDTSNLSGSTFNNILFQDSAESGLAMIRYAGGDNLEIANFILNGDIDLDTNGTGTVNANGSEVNVKAPTAANHVRAGNMQLKTGDTFAAVLYAHSVITESTWESVGPTGSGADNILDALDDVPSNAVAIMADIKMTCTTTGSSLLEEVTFHAVSNAIAVPSSDHRYAQMAAVSAGQTSDSASYDGTYTKVIIPCDSNGMMKLYWNTSSADVTNATVAFYYRGFLTD